MTSKLTRERLQEIAEDGFLKHGESKELARMALAEKASELSDIVPGAQSLQRLNHRLARAYRKRVLIPQRECRGKCRVPHALSPRAASAE